MSAPQLTIAWTPHEAVLLGPDSRLVRQPLPADDDPAAAILEAWRMEFADVPLARLMAHDPELQPAAARLAALAAEAGLRLEGVTRARRAPARWAAASVRLRSRRSRAVLGTCAVLALAAAAWRWTGSRRAAEQRQSVAEKLSAEIAADGRRRQATTEQRAEIAAACAVPPPFHAELLRRMAGISHALVLETLEIDGSDCTVRGQIVSGAPGADGAVEALRRNLFVPLERWQPENPPPAGATFALHARTLPPLPASSPPIDPIAELNRLPSLLRVVELQRTWQQTWAVVAQGSEAHAGVELRHFQLTALHHDARAWDDLLQWTERSQQEAGVSIEGISVRGSSRQDGSLDRAVARVTVRIRAG